MNVSLIVTTYWHCTEDSSVLGEKEFVSAHTVCPFIQLLWVAATNSSTGYPWVPIGIKENILPCIRVIHLLCLCTFLDLSAYWPSLLLRKEAQDMLLSIHPIPQPSIGEGLASSAPTLNYLTDFWLKMHQWEKVWLLPPGAHTTQVLGSQSKVPSKS